MKLVGKTIFILSPQDWDHIHVSKHHYTKELAARGNVVFYINPPCKGFKYFAIKSAEINKNLFVVSHSLWLPYNIKFHLPFLFKLMLNFQVFRLRKLVSNIDLVWSFTALYPNLRLFKSKKTIYHQVDNIMESTYEDPAKYSDIVLGVSESIIERFNHNNRFLIGHGVSSKFLAVGKGKVELNKMDGKLDICYCGNMNAPTLDLKIINQVVQSFPKFTFHFIGPYNINDKFNGEKLNEIRELNNSIFHGKLNTDEIIELYKMMDVFLVCYNKLSKESQQRNKSSNSHKILEYLSTGKVIVSTNIGFYEGKNNLIQMLEHDDNYEFLALFSEVVSRINTYNSVDNANVRINFAKQNSYEEKINEIESYL